VSGELGGVAGSLLTSTARTGLDWAGLGWTGLDWTGLGRREDFEHFSPLSSSSSSSSSSSGEGFMIWFNAMTYVHGGDATTTST
jgi:hypothetical protein